MIRVAINGFGRIGRLAFREMITTTEFDVVAINDLTKAEDLAYLLKYDTNHRRFHPDEISFNDDEIIISNSKRIKVYSEKDPENLPWKELNIDLVLECSGHFTKKEDAEKHIIAGAKKVLISAPSSTEGVKTIVYNVNDNIIDGTETVLSAASCTTNCIAPILKIIEDNIGIEKGFMSTIHAYTNDQATLDIAHKKGISSRRGRACAQNIVPASTGAAKAIGLVIPSLQNKLDGAAYRVPVSDGSLIDLSIEPKRNTTIDEIHNLIKEAKNETIDITFDPIVSSDILGRSLGCLIDGLSTKIVEINGKQLIKIVGWYDNEYGYTSQMMRTARALFKVN